MQGWSVKERRHLAKKIDFVTGLLKTRSGGNNLNHNIRGATIECEGWSLIFLILLFNKLNIEVSGRLYQTKTHFTNIVYQPFSRASPPSFTLYAYIIS